jgi:xylulokinase
MDAVFAVQPHHPKNYYRTRSFMNVRMPRKYLLGVDIGTSGSTGIIVDRELTLVDSVSVEHETEYPRQGWAEHDADDVWWDDFVTITQQLLKRSDIEPEDIRGVGVSAIHPAMVPLDEHGDPLRRAILYGVDTRSNEEIELLNDQIGEDRIYEVSGNSLTFQSVGPKILWYKRNEPEKFAQTDTILDATGYVVSQLTGEYTIDNAVAAFFHPLYNLSTLDWDDEMLAELDISRDMLPDPQWSTEIAGEVTAEAAEETGLAAGTPVIVGTGDAQASQLSVGAVEPGEAIFMYGTTGVIYTMLEEERTTPELWAFPHCVEGRYGLAGGMATSGAIVRWFRNEFGDSLENRDAVGKARYSHLNARASEIPPGSEGLVLLPYFSGERTPINDESARGTITGMTLSHTKYHLYRAVLEGVGYGFRHHVSAMDDAGFSIDRVKAIGGGAQSDLWRQIVSDITGVTQEYVSNPVGSPLGGAYLAGMGVGVFDNLEELKELTEVESETTPDESAASVYDEYYSVYRDLYPQIRDSMHRLAQLGNE